MLQGIASQGFFLLPCVVGTREQISTTDRGHTREPDPTNNALKQLVRAGVQNRCLGPM